MIRKFNEHVDTTTVMKVTDPEIDPSYLKRVVSQSRFKSPQVWVFSEISNPSA